MKQAALYIRVSTEEQARHGLSLPEQKASLEEYAAKHGFLIAGVYEDAGISARKSYKKRPALLRLLGDCKEGMIDVILFIKLDRWFRNVGNYYAVQDILDQCGVSWQATQEDYETTTASGRLKVNIMLSVAQDEADRTGERIKFVFEGKRARNEPVSGHVPTGYIIDGKKIVKDPKTEQAVSAYFDHYIRHGSITEAISYISDRYGLNLKYQLASAMLSKTAYYGDFNGVDCPAYITEEQHALIESRRRRTARKVSKNRTYLFSGLLSCGECGARMGGRSHKIGGVEKAEYNCPGHYQQKGCCNRTNIRETAIEAYLISTVDDHFAQYKISCDSVSANTARESDSSAEIAKLKRKLSKLKELYLNDLISLDDYRSDYAPINERISSLQQSSKPPKKHLPIENIERILNKDWKKSYEQLSRAEQRAFWRMVLSEIRVYPDRHIEYDFL